MLCRCCRHGVGCHDDSHECCQSPPHTACSQGHLHPTHAAAGSTRPVCSCNSTLTPSGCGSCCRSRSEAGPVASNLWRAHSSYRGHVTHGQQREGALGSHRQGCHALQLSQNGGCIAGCHCPWVRLHVRRRDHTVLHYSREASGAGAEVGPRKVNRGVQGLCQCSVAVGNEGDLHTECGGMPSACAAAMQETLTFSPAPRALPNSFMTKKSFTPSTTTSSAPWGKK